MTGEARAKSSMYTLGEVFSDEQCQAIIGLGEGLELREAMIRTGKEYREKVLDRSFRQVHLAELPADPPRIWIYDRILTTARQANTIYGFDIEEQISEPISFLRYSIGGHYKAHTDANEGVIAGRRISVIIQLSDPASYEGGEVELIEAGRMAERQRGSATLFPSYLLHQVHPVTAGQRYALVAWVGSARSEAHRR